MMIDLFVTIPTPGHNLFGPGHKIKKFCFRIGCLSIDF